MSFIDFLRKFQSATDIEVIQGKAKPTSEIEKLNAVSSVLSEGLGRFDDAVNRIPVVGTLVEGAEFASGLKAFETGAQVIKSTTSGLIQTAGGRPVDIKDLRNRGFEHLYIAPSHDIGMNQRIHNRDWYHPVQRVPETGNTAITIYEPHSTIRNMDVPKIS